MHIFLFKNNIRDKPKNLPEIRKNTSFLNFYFYCINSLYDINDLGVDFPFPPFSRSS